MKTFSTAISRYDYKTAIYDILALSVVAFTPALSHLTAIPFYLLEPMRIILLMSIAFTTKKNVYLLTLALPLFSFIISAHPGAVKSLLITSEMLLNVSLFFYLTKLFRNSFAGAVSSIVISKIYYYLIKFLLISGGLLSTELVSTPFILQIIVAVSVSSLLWFFYRRGRVN
jgi:hypothetical protein